jgi:predicted AAA+ superfamily ATPase
LLELVDGYLLKDIFTLENIQAPTQLLHVVKLLAQYVGQPISASKLANEVNLNKKTVERYLDLLEKTFVIHKVMPFSNKLSQSLKFKPKYYFYDVGIRNALIGNFLPPHERADIGGLWENFCFMERLKKHAYERRIHPRLYFYQSYETHKEIDIVEEYNGYTALECKWDYDRDTIALDEWDREYPSAPVSVVTRDTYMRYLL